MKKLGILLSVLYLTPNEIAEKQDLFFDTSFFLNDNILIMPNNRTIAINEQEEGYKETMQNLYEDIKDKPIRANNYQIEKDN